MAPFPSPTTKWHDTTYPSLDPTRPELSANGKTVLITGAGTGIGAETARYFARAGASRIAILGRREQPLAETKASIEREITGIEVFTQSTDVTKGDEVDAAFARFMKDGGRIDVLVSNAAFTGPVESIEDADGEAFLNGIQINLRGSMNVAKAFLRYASTDAVVIDVNSAAAHLFLVPKFASYSVAKLAVFRLWDSVAVARPELSIFHIQPGVVDTAMNREVGGVAAVGAEDHVSLPASFNVWLASPEARFLKNKFLWTNWDVDELKARAKEIESTPEFSVGLVGWPFSSEQFSFKPVEGTW